MKFELTEDQGVLTDSEGNVYVAEQAEGITCQNEAGDSCSLYDPTTSVCVEGSTVHCLAGVRKDDRYVVWIKTEGGPFYVLGKPDDGFVVLRSFGNEEVAKAYAKNCPDGWGAFVTRRT